MIKLYKYNKDNLVTYTTFAYDLTLIIDMFFNNRLILAYDNDYEVDKYRSMLYPIHNNIQIDVCVKP